MYAEVQTISNYTDKMVRLNFHFT